MVLCVYYIDQFTGFSIFLKETNAFIKIDDSVSFGMIARKGVSCKKFLGKD